VASHVDPDLLIAGTALHHGLGVVHVDRTSSASPRCEASGFADWAELGWSDRRPAPGPKTSKASSGSKMRGLAASMSSPLSGEGRITVAPASSAMRAPAA
jgi:hypothetical protein